jgi:hypothetical protein
MSAYGSMFYCEAGVCVAGQCRMTSDCANHESCNASLACVCQAGFDDCDGLAPNGCETSLDNDLDNCGMCGHQCTGSQACVAGNCG